jgi:hypothetical protein
MTTRERLEAMTLAQLRKLAGEWPTWEIDRLTKEDLIGYIAQARRLESVSQAKLRSLARQWQILGASRLERKDLVLHVLKVERWNAMTVAELRSLAREWRIEGVGRLRKKEIVQQLVQAEAWHVRPVAVRQTLVDVLLGLLLRLRKRWVAIPWRRHLGIALQVTGSLGLIVSLVCLIALPFLASRGVKLAQGVLASTAASTRAAADSLQLVGDSLGQASIALADASVTLGTTEDSLESVEPLLRSVGGLVGDEAPTTIEAARQALISAESGAKSIDQVLRTLARLEPLTGATYDPEQPLDRSLADVATGLEPLPAVLKEVQGDLDAAVEDIGPIRSSLEVVANDLVSFSASLDRLQERMYDQSSTLGDVAASTEQSAERVSVSIWIATILIEMILVGIGLEQCAVLIFGRQLWVAEGT